MKFSIHSLFFLIVLPVSVWTQIGEIENRAAILPGTLDFQKFNSEDGLAQNTIFCLLQNRRGFIWSESRHGLSRLDGSEFVNFTLDFQNPRSISDNQINTIHL